MATLDFFQAPATKAIFFSSSVGTLLSSFLFKSHWSGYDVLAFTNLRLDRIVANQFFFGSVGEMVLGLGLIYQFRTFERRLGTSKFLSFTIVSALLSIFLQMLVLVMYPGFSSSALTKMAPGPYSYVFSLFMHYFAFVPKLQRRRILGAEFSGKTFVYFWGSQLLLSRGRESLITGLCGLIGGLLCLSPKLPFHKARLPNRVQAFGKSYLAPLFASRSPAEVAAETAQQRRERLAMMGLNPMAMQGQQGAQGEQLLPGGSGLFANALQAQQMQQLEQMQQRQQQQPEPSEEQVNTLMALGFDRARVLQALRMNNNNTERAADSLIQNAG